MTFKDWLEEKYSLEEDSLKDSDYDYYYQKYRNQQTSTSTYTRRPSMYERTRAQVYATGNRWAIENFNATH